MKGFVASKGRLLRTSISSTHFRLTPQNANTQNRIIAIDLWPGHASRNIVFTSYPGSVPECYYCEFVCGQVPTNFEEKRYHMSSKLHILQYQTQRFSGGLLYETDGDACRLA